MAWRTQWIEKRVFPQFHYIPLYASFKKWELKQSSKLSSFRSSTLRGRPLALTTAR